MVDRTKRNWSLAVLASGLLAACGGGGGSSVSYNQQPAFIAGPVAKTSFDGVSDDLLTAGLGKSGLAAATAPAVSATPTAAELRRLAIYNNYRALVDMTSAGGYGVFYGPNVDSNGVAGTGEGRIAGIEYRAFSDDGSGQRNVTLLVQIPAGFDKTTPCIVAAVSSGSRGVYGAISTGEWGLKRGCAVAYTDKGTGAAPHDLANDTVPLIDGTRSTSAAAGAAAQFRAALSSAELAAFNAATPNRFAFKHAHSQRNPEKDWGLFTLQAIEFAFFAINDQFAGANPATGQKFQDFKPENTLVIASSASNGGAAALAAAELDRSGWIDGVAVSEPAVELPASLPVTIRRGSSTPMTFGKPLFDYTSYSNLFQVCATQSSQLAGTPALAFVVPALAAARCASLKDKGLLTGATTAAQADEALQKLRDYGWEPESTVQFASHAAFEVASAVSVTFANAWSRSSVKDHLCGYSYGATTAAGVPTTLAAGLPIMFSTGNGVPPSSGVQLINNLSPAGPTRDLLSVSASTGRADINVDGALCLRGLLTGSDTAAKALQAGLGEVRRNGNLGGKPAIIVHGRDDALIPVNHASRAYTALNKSVEGAASKLSYIEVANAQHFDSFIGLPAVLPGYDTRYVPLHLYLFRALDAMYAHLKSGVALPGSQVVRTVPRGGTPGSAPALTAANVPAISTTPAAANAISFGAGTLNIPD